MFKRRISSHNYYSNRSNELRSRRSLKSKFFVIKNFAIKACIVLLLGGVLYAALFTPILAIKNIAIEGNKAISSAEVENTIKSFSDKKFLKIFNNNLIFLDSSEIENAIRNRFSNIEAVSVEKKFPQSLKISIKEKPADIAWCNKIKIEEVSDTKDIADKGLPASEIPKCYLSDEEGVIYEKADDNSASDSIKVYRDEPIKVGAKIGDENLKNFVRKIFYDFNRKTGLSLSYLYVLPLASRELHLITSESWKIYFDLNRGADEQMDVLNAFLKNEVKENDKKNIDYEYIDLRVVDRVFIKPKNEVKIGN